MKTTLVCGVVPAVLLPAMVPYVGTLNQVLDISAASRFQVRYE